MKVLIAMWRFANWACVVYRFLVKITRTKTFWSLPCLMQNSLYSIEWKHGTEQCNYCKWRIRRSWSLWRYYPGIFSEAMYSVLARNRTWTSHESGGLNAMSLVCQWGINRWNFVAGCKFWTNALKFNCKLIFEVSLQVYTLKFLFQTAEYGTMFEQKRMTIEKNIWKCQFTLQYLIQGRILYVTLLQTWFDFFFSF
jgi:hypothetical protein